MTPSSFEAMKKLCAGVCEAHAATTPSGSAARALLQAATAILALTYSQFVEQNAAAQVAHGLCHADDPNEEADQGATDKPTGNCASPEARGVAPSVSDDSAGTSIPVSAAPSTEGAETKEAIAAASRSWQWPINSVGRLIENLKSFPPEMPFYTAYFVEIDGERVARTTHPSISRETVGRGRIEKYSPDQQSMVMWATAFPAPAEFAALAQMGDGELWSFLRSVLEQGASIQMDNAAGKYPTYEHYAARMDEAARERADKLIPCAGKGGREVPENILWIAQQCAANPVMISGDSALPLARFILSLSAQAEGRKA